MNLSHFISRAMQSGNLHEEHLSEPEFRQLLYQRIDALDVAAARNDVSRFVKDVEALKIWSQGYFQELVKRMKITTG